MKLFVDSWGLFPLTREPAEMLGDLKELKPFMQHEQHKLAAAVRNAPHRAPSRLQMPIAEKRELTPGGGRRQCICIMMRAGGRLHAAL